MSKSNKQQKVRYKAALNKIVSRWNENKNAANSSVVLEAIPTQNDSERLSKLRGKPVPLAKIFRSMGTSQTYIYALQKEKHLESAERIIKNIETKDRDMLDYYLENLKEHLEEAGFTDDYDTGLALIGFRLEEIKTKLIWSYTHPPCNDEKDKKHGEELFLKHFPKLSVSATDNTLKPQF